MNGCHRHPETMQAEVITVALTAAGHLVPPAAGKAMEKTQSNSRSTINAEAFQGSATTRCQLPACTMGSRGGTNDMKTARNKLVKVNTDTEICCDFRAQMKDAA